MLHFFQKQLDTQNASIRLVDASEIPALQEIARQTFMETYSHEQGFSEASMAEIFAEEKISGWVNHEDTICLGVFVDDNLAGYALVNCHEQQATLDKFYLLKSEQGKGLGRILMEAVYAELRNRPQIEEMQIKVWESNQQAIGFYQRMGFAISGERVFYSFSQDDLPTYDEVMVKTKTPAFRI